MEFKEKEFNDQANLILYFMKRGSLTKEVTITNTIFFIKVLIPSIENPKT